MKKLVMYLENPVALDELEWPHFSDGGVMCLEDVDEEEEEAVRAQLALHASAMELKR